jgi:hypothetical protein
MCAQAYKFVNMQKEALLLKSLDSFMHTHGAVFNDLGAAWVRARECTLSFDTHPRLRREIFPQHMTRWKQSCRLTHVRAVCMCVCGVLCMDVSVRVRALMMTRNSGCAREHRCNAADRSRR